MSKLGDNDFEKYLEELQEANDNITWWTNRFKAVERDNKQLKERFERLVQEHIDTITRNEEKQQRIDKAIEYIKEHQEKQFAFNFEYALRDNEIDVLLEILGDKE